MHGCLVTVKQESFNGVLEQLDGCLNLCQLILGGDRIGLGVGLDSVWDWIRCGIGFGVGMDSVWDWIRCGIGFGVGLD